MSGSWAGKLLAKKGNIAQRRAKVHSNPTVFRKESERRSKVQVFLAKWGEFAKIALKTCTIALDLSMLRLFPKKTCSFALELGTVQLFSRKDLDNHLSFALSGGDWAVYKTNPVKLFFSAGRLTGRPSCIGSDSAHLPHGILPVGLNS